MKLRYVSEEEGAMNPGISPPVPALLPDSLLSRQYAPLFAEKIA